MPLVGVLLVFFVVLDYLERVDDFMDRGATTREVLGTYYVNYLPEMVKLMSPLAVFLAVIYVTGRLAQSMQIVALRSAGVSLGRLLVPYLAVGLLMTGFMLWFNGWVVPPSQAVVLEFQNRYFKDAPEEAETSQIFRQNAPGSVLSVGFFDRREGRAFRVSLQDFEADSTRAPTGAPEGAADRLARRLDAQEMTWVDSLGVWRMRDATLRTFGDGGETGRRAIPQLDTVLTVRPRDLARTERDADRLTIPEAAAYVAALERAGADDLGRPLVGYYTKFAYPFANLILVLIGVPLAAARRRGGQAVQFGAGLFIAFVYLAVQKLTEPFGYAGTLPPLVVAWLPHAVFLGLALWLLLRARR